MASLIVSIVTIALLIISTILFPSIKIKKLSISSYVVIALLGACTILSFHLIIYHDLYISLTSTNGMNPLKILVLFISMSFLSVILDELGFFKYLAIYAVKKAKSKQIVIFIYLYIITSILTIFTSNDIVILTFTPFICYFSKSAKINPLPYLVSEFVAANTWSMMLLIGNPTNIYIATGFDIQFIDYLSVMWLPTIAAGMVSIIIIILLFYKDLKKPMQKEVLDFKIQNKFLLIVGIIHLGLTIVFLALSQYLQIEMWLITLLFAISVSLFTLMYYLIKKEKPTIYIDAFRKIPYSVIPFLLSMFIIVCSLKDFGWIDKMAILFSGDGQVMRFGLFSFLSCNLINNIPMSVLFKEVLLATTYQTKSIYAVIIGSNIGAYLTPLGALAGIMWMNILKKQGINFSFKSFIKYGIVTAIPTIMVSLLVLIVK